MNDEPLYPILEEKNTRDYIEMMSKFFCKKFACYHLLEDLRQDFYIAVMEISNKKPKHPRVYILNEARLKVYDILRSKKYKERYGIGQHQKPITHSIDAIAWAIPDKSLPTETALCEEATLDTIPQILSGRQTDVLWSNKVEGWTQDELGRRYGVNRSMVSKDMAAGIMKLRKKWKVRVETP